MYIYFLVRICWNFFPSELSLPPWVTLCIKEEGNYMHLVIGHTYIYTLNGYFRGSHSSIIYKE